MAGLGGRDGVSRYGHGEELYSSPEYQEILHLRTDNVISDLILVDGVRPDFTSAGWAEQIRAAIQEGAAAES